MLTFLGKDRISDLPRHRRRFLCCCARRLWPLVVHDGSKYAIEVAERFLDGQADALDLRAALAAARKAQVVVDEMTPEAILAKVPPSIDTSKTDYAHCYLKLKASELARAAVFATANRVPFEPLRSLAECLRVWIYLHNATEECLTIGVCDLIRELYGNPFREAQLDPACLNWHDRTVVRLAQHCHDDEDFALLPVLADALEEAGCTDLEILQHLRQPSPHVRGCWVLDLILSNLS